MRFLVDECTGPAVAQWLRKQKHDVFSVHEEARGLDDENIIKRAFSEDRILITNDKDFGEKVRRGGYPHRGVVLLRLTDERAVVKIQTLERLIEAYGNRLADSFVVATETRVRFGRLKE